MFDVTSVAHLAGRGSARHASGRAGEAGPDRPCRATIVRRRRALEALCIRLRLRTIIEPRDAKYSPERDSKARQSAGRVIGHCFLQAGLISRGWTASGFHAPYRLVNLSKMRHIRQPIDPVCRAGGQCRPWPGRSGAPRTLGARRWRHRCAPSSQAGPPTVRSGRELVARHPSKARKLRPTSTDGRVAPLPDEPTGGLRRAFRVFGAGVNGRAPPRTRQRRDDALLMPTRASHRCSAPRCHAP